MIDAVKRKCAAELAIGLLACAAIHYLGVAPIQARAAQAKAEAERADAPVSAGFSLTADQFDTIDAQSSQILEAAAKRSAPVTDQTSLFAIAMSLAEAHNVQVDRLEPQPPQSIEPPQPPPPAGEPAPPPPPADLRSTCSFQVVGTYGDVTRFVRGVARAPWFVRLVSVHIEPDGGSRRIRGAIKIECYSFQTPDGAPVAEQSEVTR